MALINPVSLISMIIAILVRVLFLLPVIKVRELGTLPWA